MDVYLDTSLLVALFIDDPHSEQAHQLLGEEGIAAHLSDWGRLEFCSALARLVRMHDLTDDEATASVDRLDAWAINNATIENVTSADIVAATEALRGWALNLRAADAVHIAASQRLGLTLVTFDDRMEVAAGALGVPVRG